VTLGGRLVPSVEEELEPLHRARSQRSRTDSRLQELVNELEGRLHPARAGRAARLDPLGVAMNSFERGRSAGPEHDVDKTWSKLVTRHQPVTFAEGRPAPDCASGSSLDIGSLAREVRAA
jgi:hypothetical protein